MIEPNISAVRYCGLTCGSKHLRHRRHCHHNRRRCQNDITSSLDIRFTFTSTVAFRSLRYPVYSLRIHPFSYDRFPERNQMSEKMSEKNKDLISLPWRNFVVIFELNTLTFGNCHYPDCEIRVDLNTTDCNWIAKRILSCLYFPGINFWHLSLSDTQDITPKAEHSIPSKLATRSSKLSRTDRYIYVYIYHSYCVILRTRTRSYRHFIVDSTDDVRTTRNLAAGTTQMTRGLDQGSGPGVHTRKSPPHHAHATLRSFSAERRRTNKSWDPAWNCVGRLLLLPPQHSVLSHRCTEPGHRQRQAGE